MSAGGSQARVKAAIDRLVASGDEAGAQVAVVERGRVVVDAVSGSTGPGRGRAVASDTLFWAASTAKGVASAVAHVLVERGELAYDLRAVDVWPEFGAIGIGDEVHFGVPEDLLGRVARQQPPIGPPPPPPEPGSPVDRALPPGIRPDADYANRRDVLTADIPSEGTMTARGAPCSTPRCSTASSWSRPRAGRPWRRCGSRARTRSWASRRRGRSAQPAAPQLDERNDDARARDRAG